MYGNNFYVGCLFIKRQSQLRRENACTSELQFLALLISRSRPVADSLKIAREIFGCPDRLQENDSVFCPRRYQS